MATNKKLAKRNSHPREKNCRSWCLSTTDDADNVHDRLKEIIRKGFMNGFSRWRIEIENGAWYEIIIVDT